MTVHGFLKCRRCNGNDVRKCFNQTCLGMFCYRDVHDGNKLTVEYGCQNYTCGAYPNVCCRNADYCNENLTDAVTGVTNSPASLQNLTLPTSSPGYASTQNFNHYNLGLIVLGAVFIMFLVGAVVAFFMCKRRNNAPPEIEVSMDQKPLQSISLIIASQNALSSSSDNGGILRQRTVAMDVILGNTIGQGSFGKVYEASYRGDPVAVKVFEARYLHAFFKEKNIYERRPMAHNNNILRFFACDTHSAGGGGKAVELWLITELCPLGSLHQFLEKGTIDVPLCIRMCSDIASGLAFLHHGINDLRGHIPAVAHRDLKPSNILLRANGQCVIGDFGYAVCETFMSKSICRARGPTAIEQSFETTHHFLVGTVRYMSPEVLSSTIIRTDFQSLIWSDMYSLALVMWEIGARTVVDGKGYGSHLLPYDEIKDPTIDIMTKLVVQERRRPTFPQFWKSSEDMQTLRSIIAECWRGEPNRRLSAYKVKLELQKLTGVHKSSSIPDVIAHVDAGEIV